MAPAVLGIVWLRARVTNLARHIGNAGRRDTKLTADDETGQKVWILTKLHPERKMDACMAAVLSWQARMDVVGKLPKKRGKVGSLRRGGFG